jgi:hypothetical protein
MAKCAWCGKNFEELEEYIDAIGQHYSICKDCKKSVDEFECRKCGRPTDPGMMVNGLCMTCVQADLKEKSKRREEVMMGVDMDAINELSSGVTLTNDDYDRWMTMGKAFTPNDMKNSRELRRLWIMVKFNAAGVYDNETITKNLADVETLLDRNFSKLIGNKCRLLIANDAEKRREVRQNKVIDYENETYILQA